MPKKGPYRSRAHSNPLSDTNMPVPLTPDEAGW